MKRHRWKKVKNTGRGSHEHNLVCSGCGWQIPAGFKPSVMLETFQIAKDCDEAKVELIHSS